MTYLGPRGANPKPEKVDDDPAYLNRVRGLPCACCGKPPPNEAHHCRDKPDFDERGLYVQTPGAGRKSHDRDAIPLCGPCHRMFHLDRPRFRQLAGKDYSHIGPTRAAFEEREIDF